MQSAEDPKKSKVMEKISVVILSGGRSSRMGKDKAVLLLEGRTFADHLIKNLSGAGEMFLSVRRKEDFPEIALQHICDEYPGCGPLAGIHRACKQASCDWVFVTACDTPLVTRRTLEELCAHVTEKCDAVIPEEPDGRRHVLCGLYNRRVLSILEQELQSGNYRVNAVLSRLRTVCVPVSEFTDGEKVFRNVNTPEDYREICGK